MIDKDLTLALCGLQEAVQTASAAAKRANNEGVYHELRKLAWDTANLLANVARDQDRAAS